MPTFNLYLDLSSIYTGYAPNFEVLIDGVVVSGFSVTSGFTNTTLSLSYAGDAPSYLSFRFNDNQGEVDRSVTINDVRLNGNSVAGGSLSRGSLLQGQESQVNVLAEQSSFGIPGPGAGTDAVINGTAGADNLNGTAGNDTISGFADKDFIKAGGGVDTVNGGDGHDVIRGGDGGDTLNGDNGQDLIKGENDNDTINGGAGHDTLIGGAGVDTINGDAGNDVLKGDAGIDTLRGGADNDKLDGGTEGDFLYGDAGNDKLYGRDGADTLYGGTGHDRLFGGNGIDILDGEDGNDRLYGEGNSDTLYGRAGFDLLVGGDGADTLFGGDDNDTLQGDAGIDTLRGENGNDRLRGGDDGDFLYGDAGSDVVIGDAGNDELYGGTGNDLLEGGTGNDELYGEDDNDNLYGQEGDDDLYGGDGNDMLHGQAGVDTLIGGAGNDTLHGDNFLTAIGQAGTVTQSQPDRTTWHTITFDAVITNPAVVLTINSENDADPYFTLKVRNVSDTGFEWQIREWDYQDGVHAAETISWFAVAEGRHTLDDGTVIEAGTDTVSGLTDTIVNFSSGTAFGSAPVVMSQVVTDNETSAMVTHNDNRGTGSFRVHVEEEKANQGPQVTADEDFSWIAIESGGNADSGVIAGLTSDSVTHNFSNVTYSGGSAFPSSAPVVIASIQNEDGGDPSNTNVVNITDSDFDIRVAEEESTPGITHTRETMGYYALTSGLLYADSTDGDDIINGGAGLDNLYGGDGADTFVFEAASAYAQTDIIHDFRYFQDDVLDISDLISGFTGTITDHVQFVDSGSDTLVQIDSTGASGFSTIANLNGVADLDIAALYANGNIIV